MVDEVGNASFLKTKKGIKRLRETISLLKKKLRPNKTRRKSKDHDK